MKNISILPELPCHADSRSLIANMRPSPSHPGCLSPVDAPKTIIDYPGTPVAVIKDADHLTTIFSVADGWLTACDSVNPPQPLFETTAVAVTAVTTLARRVIFNLDGRRPIEIERTDGLWHIVSERPLPEVRFSTDSTITLSKRTPARTLSGTYTHWSGPIADSDADRIAADLADTYISLAEQARTAGRYIQPIMAWWRLVDTDRRTIHRSCPVIIGPDGIQACDPISASVSRQSDQWKNISGFSMSLRAFSPTVSVSPSQWTGCKVEILVTPPIDVIATDSRSSATFAFGPSSASEATLTATMLHNDPVPMITAMLDRIESISVVAASVGADCDTPVTVPLRPARLLDTHVESASLFRSLYSTIPARDQLIDMCCPPHTFSAKAAVVDSDTVVWGDITPIPASPPLPSDIAVEWNDNTQWA